MRVKNVKKNQIKSLSYTFNTNFLMVRVLPRNSSFPLFPMGRISELTFHYIGRITLTVHQQFYKQLEDARRDALRSHTTTAALVKRVFQCRLSCGNLPFVVLVSVGFEYESCPDLILWEKRTAVLQGYESSASKLGGWTVDKHHALNIQSGESTLKSLLRCSILAGGVLFLLHAYGHPQAVGDNATWLKLLFVWDLR